MRRTSVVVGGLLGLFAASCSGQQPDGAVGAVAAGPAAAPPRLVVMCSVDQLATWVFDAGRPFFAPDGGFARLLRDGTSFDECAYLHGCTETGPGHATLGTGAPARAHGIVKNQWFDDATGKIVYCVEDPRAEPLPGFAEGRGRSASLLLVPTLGDHLQACVGPAAKVVSISIKDRSAILMGGQHADSVAWFVNSSGRFVTNRTWSAEVPAWLQALDERAPADAFFGWEWAPLGSPAAYADCQDERPFELPHPSSGGRTLPVEITGGRDEPDSAFYTEVYFSPIANELVWIAGEAALRAEGLGADDVPDVLCLSFSANDTVGHNFGPESVEARDTLLRLDELLGRVLRTLDEQVGAGRYVFLLSADHGVAPTPEAAREQGKDAGRGIFHSRARAAADQALRQHFGADGRFVRQASEQSLFLDPAAVAAAAKADDPAAKKAALAAAAGVVAAAVLKVPGIERSFVVGELLQQQPDPDDAIQSAMWYAANEQRVGDVLMVFKPYWIEGAVPATHGSPHEYDRRVPLLAAGPGLRAGFVSHEAVSPGLMAVLAAHLLGLPELSAAVDRVPAEVLAR